MGSMDTNLDADRQYRDRLDLHSSSRNGNPGNLTGYISNTTGSGIDLESISFLSDSHSALHDSNGSVNFQSSGSNVNNVPASSQSFLMSQGSLSPDVTHPDGNGGDNEQTQGQKKVKAPRLYHKKSRNGCQRCKARRVKVCVSFY